MSVPNTPLRWAILALIVMLIGQPIWSAQPPLKPLGKGLEFPEGAEWLNVEQPLTLKDLRGKLVLLDFWTYCCINCMHVLPTLKQVEEAYPQQLVVVGVHTAKFQTEKDTENIREAVLRYEINHPVLNDVEQVLWDGYGVNTWPTLVLLDPEGSPIWVHKGEIPFKDLERVISRAVSKFAKSISAEPFRNVLESSKVEPTPLRFPGKIVADAATNRLFIADTNHNRIVVCDTQGKLIKVIGKGSMGAKDGSAEEAEFRHPQGMALASENRLYVADTENHTIRRIDLDSWNVTTVAGTGVQSNSAFPGHDKANKLPKRLGKRALGTAIASPWDLWHDGQTLYIAMAGPHQIWKLDGDEKLIAPYAGNGIEDIVDGALLPSAPYTVGSSSFAQPSGLASDGKWLYVADSEGSSLRAVSLDGKGSVQTLVGTANLTTRRLFTFGDVDGSFLSAKLQHPLGLAYHNQKLYVVDTYNNKVKVCNLKEKTIKTLLGDSATPNAGDVRLDEPGGLAILGDQLFIADTNAHDIKVFHLKDSTASSFHIEGLRSPVSGAKKAPPPVELPRDAKPTEPTTWSVARDATKLSVDVKLELPEGWKINADSPSGYVVQQREKQDGRITLAASKQFIKPPSAEFSIELEIDPKTKFIELAVVYYYCQKNGTGVCLADSVLFPIHIERQAEAPARQKLSFSIPTP